MKPYPVTRQSALRRVRVRSGVAGGRTSLSPGEYTYWFTDRGGKRIHHFEADTGRVWRTSDRLQPEMEYVA